MGIRERLSESKFAKLYKVAPKSAKLMTIFGGSLGLVLVIFVLFGSYLTPYDALAFSDDLLQPPSSKHLMGTDLLGRDLLSRLIVGSKYSLGSIIA